MDNERFKTRRLISLVIQETIVLVPGIFFPYVVSFKSYQIFSYNLKESNSDSIAISLWPLISFHRSHGVRFNDGDSIYKVVISLHGLISRNTLRQKPLLSLHQHGVQIYRQLVFKPQGNVFLWMSAAMLDDLSRDTHPEMHMQTSES